MNWLQGLKLRKRKGEREDGPRQKRQIIIAGTAVFIVLVSLMLCSYAWARKSVVLVCDGKQQVVTTVAGNVEKLLASQKITLLEKDEVEPSLDTPLQEGMVVTVHRAVDFNLVADGVTTAARTRASTVGDALTEYNIALAPEDEVIPSLDAPVTPGMLVQVFRVKTVSEEVIVPINYETKKKYTVNLEEGVTRVVREGRDGTERQTWQVVYRDGVECSRSLSSRETITPPIHREVLVGTSKVVSRGGQNIRYSDSREMVATAYTHTGRTTASGVYPYRGVMAVDPSVIPMGTRVYVDGYGYATALDRGSAISGNRIDLFFETRYEALNWGVRRVKVYFLN